MALHVTPCYAMSDGSCNLLPPEHASQRLLPGKHMDNIRRQPAAVNVQTSHAAPLALQLSRKTKVGLLRTSSMRAHLAAMPL